MLKFYFNRHNLSNRFAMSAKVISIHLTSYLIPVTLMILISLGIVYGVYGALYWDEMIVGWTIALSNGLLMMWINQISFRHRGQKSIFWGLVVNGIRAISLLMLLSILHTLEMMNFEPLIVTVLIGYFSFLYSEIYILHSGSQFHEMNTGVRPPDLLPPHLS